MPLYAIRTNSPTRSGGSLWFPFEHPAGSVQELSDLIAQQGYAHGTSYHEARGDRNERILIQPEECTVWPASLISIKPYTAAEPAREAVVEYVGRRRR